MPTRIQEAIFIPWPDNADEVNPKLMWAPPGGESWDNGPALPIPPGESLLERLTDIEAPALTEQARLALERATAEAEDKSIEELRSEI